MKAIQTKYNGCLFRSRLEARWAIFLDVLGIKWRYEIEGFDLDGEWYLPDFWLPCVPERSFPDGAFGVAGYWLEIKPSKPSEREKRLLRALAMHTKHHSYMIYGDPHPGEFEVDRATNQGLYSNGLVNDFLLEVNHESESWKRLRKEHFEEFGFMPTPVEKFTALDFPFYVMMPFFNSDEQAVNLALRQARSARFEHGVTP